MQTKQVNILKEYILNTILPDSTLKKKTKICFSGKIFTLNSTLTTESGLSNVKENRYTNESISPADDLGLTSEDKYNTITSLQTQQKKKLVTISCGII